MIELDARRAKIQADIKKFGEHVVGVLDGRVPFYYTVGMTLYGYPELIAFSRNGHPNQKMVLLHEVAFLLRVLDYSSKQRPPRLEINGDYYRTRRVTKPSAWRQYATAACWYFNLPRVPMLQVLIPMELDAPLL